MPINIKILPSGRNFPSKGNSSLLEAGLHAGLALGYGCSNGNCGECLAKIISGEVRKVRHHDYFISEEKRLTNHVLMCCHSAVTDVVLEASEARNSTEIPQQRITARVRNIEYVNNNVALLHLKTPRSNRLRFLAGQHVQLGGENMPTAKQAISSCPCDDMNLHFQIPRLVNDAFSDHVFNQLNKGDRVNIEGPMGDFVLNENSTHPMVFIAWHTGFAPIRSLIEHAMSLELTQNMFLVWVAPGMDDCYQDNLCRSWQDAFDNFHYLPVAKEDVAKKDVDEENVDEEGIDKEGIDGNIIGGEAIIKLLNINQNELSNYDFYISSPKPCKNLPTARTFKF